MATDSALQLSSVVIVNRVIWIRSVKPDDLPEVDKVDKDLRPYFHREGIPFELHVLQSAAEFNNLLEDIAKRASSEGLKPILFIDTHGGPDRGIYIVASKEFVPSAKFVESLRPINIATGNNLVVVSAACFSLEAIREVSILKETPYFIFVASEKEFYFRPDEIVSFFKDTFDGLDITTAHLRHLANQTTLIHAEKMLLIPLIRYIRDQCMGEGLEKRKKRLIDKHISEKGVTDTPELREQLSKSLDEKMRPTQDLVDKFVKQFLIGKQISISIDDVMAAVNSRAA